MIAARLADTFEMPAPRVRLVSSSSALAEWDALRDCQLTFVNGIQLIYSESGESQQERKRHLPPTVNSLELVNLQANSWYQIKLAAETDFGLISSERLLIHTTKDAFDN